ncbi:MAG TPA: hypothetical protein VFR80_16465 [Pyrinomonadaceae bacterium]|nr:hypothetical protein [Pyrinomonadaceae bacterium]
MSSTTVGEGDNANTAPGTEFKWRDSQSYLRQSMVLGGGSAGFPCAQTCLTGQSVINSDARLSLAIERLESDG